jgi:hypothetical protein
VGAERRAGGGMIERGHRSVVASIDVVGGAVTQLSQRMMLLMMIDDGADEVGEAAIEQ